jgi:hypothetical protein
MKNTLNEKKTKSKTQKQTKLTQKKLTQKKLTQKKLKQKTDECLLVAKYTKNGFLYEGPSLNPCRSRFLDIIRQNFNIPEDDPNTILIKWFKKSGKDRVRVTFRGGYAWIVTKTCRAAAYSYYLGYETMFYKGRLYAEVWYEE